MGLLRILAPHERQWVPVPDLPIAVAEATVVTLDSGAVLEYNPGLWRGSTVGLGNLGKSP